MSNFPLHKLSSMQDYADYNLEQLKQLNRSLDRINDAIDEIYESNRDDDYDRKHPTG